MCYECTKCTPSSLPLPVFFTGDPSDNVKGWLSRGIQEMFMEDKKGKGEENDPKTCPANNKYKLLKLIILFVSQAFPITFCLLITEYWSSSLPPGDTQFAVLLSHR